MDSIWDLVDFFSTKTTLHWEPHTSSGNMKIYQYETAMHESCLRDTTPKPRPPTNSIDSNHVVRHRCTLTRVGFAHTLVITPTKGGSHKTMSPQVASPKALQSYTEWKESKMIYKELATTWPRKQDTNNKNKSQAGKPNTKPHMVVTMLLTCDLGLIMAIIDTAKFSYISVDFCSIGKCSKSQTL